MLLPNQQLRLKRVMRLFAICLIAQFALMLNVANAADHDIGAVGVKFDPIFIYIEPGDQIHWSGMVGHNIETIDTMVPEGQEKVISELGDNVSATFDVPGIVVYKCTPHWGARMGGIIVVGKPEDPAAIIDAYLESTKTDKVNLPAKGLLKKLKKDMESKGLI